MVTANALLDLDVRGRGEKFRFDLYDKTGAYQGVVHPLTACKINNSSGQQIKRRIDGFKLSPDEYNDVNPLTARIRPFHVLSDGTEWPLGEFLFADASSTRFSYGRSLHGTLADQGLVLAQPISQTMAFDKGTLAAEAITAVFEAAGFFNAIVGPSTFTLGTATGYPAGKNGATFAKILDELCKKAGYYPSFFDNTGTPRVDVASSSLSAETPGLIYRSGGRIAADSITESNDLLAAPNRFIVVDTTATTGNISYVFDIPADAPHSVENRGWALPITIEAPGVGDITQAEAVARSHYSSTVLAYETIQFSGPPDPRHDTFDVIGYAGDGGVLVNYLETSWALTCAPGAPMQHTCVRSYL